jgi:hypothetical protein
MKFSLCDIVLAGQDGIEGLVGLSKDAKNAAEGLRTCVVMTRSSVQTSGHEEV